jgi:hypothetical protein
MVLRFWGSGFWGLNRTSKHSLSWLLGQMLANQINKAHVYSVAQSLLIVYCVHLVATRRAHNMVPCNDMCWVIERQTSLKMGRLDWGGQQGMLSYLRQGGAASWSRNGFQILTKANDGPFQGLALCL